MPLGRMPGAGAQVARRWFERALAELEPSGLVREAVAGADELGGYQHILVCALGKAAGPMLEGWRAGAAGRGAAAGRVEVIVARGGHPEPDAASLASGRAMLEAARRLAAGPKPALLTALVSGGGSTMAEVPVAGGLEQLRARNRALVRGGAGIGEINRERIARSTFKGGKLAAVAAGCDIVTWILSDVPGDDPAMVASGPTVPGSRWRVLAGNGDVCAAVAERARADGYDPVVVDATADEWEAERAAAYLVDRWRGLRASGRRPCLIAGGEVRVRVAEQAAGRGGRNQHLALLVAARLRPEEPGTFFSAGTDGLDGNTDAAGAAVDGGTAGLARALGWDVEGALAGFDSHPLLAAVGAVVRTGPTGNNLRDVRVML